MSTDLFPNIEDNSIRHIEEWISNSNMLQWLNFSAAIENDRLLYRLGFEERHIGNEFIRALHGGVVSSFLQTCSTAELVGRAGPGVVMQTVSVHCDFLRPARAKDMQGEAKIIQRGRRVAFIEAIGWHEDPNKPVGKANVAIRLQEDGTS